MTPEQCSSINGRVSVLEVKLDTHMDILTEIKDTQKTIHKGLSEHMEKEEAARWKVAAFLIVSLLGVVAGLIGVVYSGIPGV